VLCFGGTWLVDERLSWWQGQQRINRGSTQKLKKEEGL
jgi:hypothetical protein